MYRYLDSRIKSGPGRGGEHVGKRRQDGEHVNKFRRRHCECVIEVVSIGSVEDILEHQKNDERWKD
jgi:hypothetical protein